MHKKRGLFLVVLVIVLLLFAFSAYGATTAEVLVDGRDNCDKRLGDFIPSDNTEDKTECGNEYLNARDLARTVGLTSGCAVGVYEDDGIGISTIDDDDCGITFAFPGEIIGNTFAKLQDRGGEEFCKWEASAGSVIDPDDFQCGGNLGHVGSCFEQQFATRGTSSYLCNTDNLWHQCDNTVVGTSVQIGLELYHCINNGGNYDWVPSTTPLPDADGDNVPDEFDCNDNDSTVHEKYNCIVDPATGNEDCTVAGAVPAIVICGDGKDNTCGDVPNEDDNCETNELACKDTFGQNSWLEEEGNTPLAGNNNCCGNDGLDDLGMTATDSLNFQKVCLNKQLASENDEFADWDDAIGSEWFWANAQNNEFHIVTIKKPTEQYDLVSDSEKWVACTADSEGQLESEDLSGAQKNIANQFYCYNEGLHWSFAQCLPEAPVAGQQDIDNGDKKRAVGDGLFTVSPDIDPGDVTTLEGVSLVSIDLHLSFDQYYGPDFRQDIAPYNQFEFSARFAGEIFTPADIVVTLRGQDQIIFQQNVLTTAVNNPLIEVLEDGFYHFKIPLPGNLKGVETLEIETLPEGNNIVVRNIFFSQQSGSSLLCSGQTSRDQSSWIDSADYFVTTGNPVSGKLVCGQIYGTDAWVGDDAAARCCGDAKNEYYVNNDYNADPSASSCWNSKSVAAGDAVTTVEYEVEYTDIQNVVTYPDVPFSYYYQSLNSVSQIFNERLSYAQSTKKLTELNVDKNAYLLEDPENFLELVPRTSTPVNIYFYDPIRALPLDQKFFVKDLRLPINPIYILAEFSNNYVSEVSTGVSEPSPREIMKYTCTKNQCLYPLPGNPPYKITNLHPGLYTLYFVDNANPNGILIAQPNQEFSTKGNILVKNVPLQVIFDNGLDDTGAYQNQPGFYGCAAAAYISSGIQGFTNENHCAVRENKFCAYSAAGTINSWSDETITSTIEIDPSGETLITETNTYPPEERTNPTTILPGRNLLANPEFTESSGVSIIGWDIIDNVPAGQQPLIDQAYIQQFQSSGILTLQLSDRLLSIPLAVEENINLAFTQEASCNNVKGYLVDKNGNIEEVLPSTPLGQLGQVGGGTTPLNPNQQYLSRFNTKTAAYLYLEFTGGTVGPTIGQGTQCDIKNPFLQRVDVQPTEFVLEGDQDKPRAGAACCPQGYCWNGYSCVAPMNEFTEISEQVGENHYRCIDGSWQKQDRKYDWNGELSGFCGAVSQCFVLSSQNGAVPGTTYDQVYSGNFPTCINSGEYVFDNFCEDGSWTSRTKVLAQELLNLVGNGDHSLYCSGYEDVLLNIQGVESLLGGVGQRSIGIGESETVCFEAISGPQGIRLVPAEKNKCINNACVLVDDNDNVIFATTLNKNPSEQNSFLEILGLPSQDLAQACPGNFAACNIGLSEGVIYYNSSLNAIIYSKQPLSLQPGLIARFLTFLQNIFRTQPLLSLDNLGFKNFQDIYSLQHGNQRVLAVKGIFNEEPKVVALYENFDTPICDYLTISRINDPELNIPLQAQPLSCVLTSEGFNQINATKGLDFLWPELTGKLRSE